MDRLDEWRIFVAVAQLKSFANAARALGRSPQAVTRAVAALEARLGVRLLNRTTRAVALSHEGEAYLARSRHALAEIDALEAPADASPTLRGALSITAPVLFGQLHVAPLVTAFLTEHPAVDARVLLVDRVVSLVEDGVDVGVRIGGLPDSSLVARLVGHVRTVVCASPAYVKRHGVPATPEALADHACIAFSATTPTPDRWSFPRKGQREARVRVHPRLVVNTAQAAVDAAASGLGVVRVFSYQVDAAVAKGSLTVVLADHEPPASPVHVVTLPGLRSRAAAEFVEVAAARLRRQLARG